MRWNSLRLGLRRGRFRLLFAIALTAALILSAFILFAASDEKAISVFSPTANYSIPVVERNGLDYVGLLELLEPLGTVSSKATGRRWKFEFKGVEAECNGGDRRMRIGGNKLELPANFLLENGRGLIPLSSVETVLARFLNLPINFRQESRRLFVGEVEVHFTAELNDANPPALVLDFTSPVNPNISTEARQLRMVFAHQAVVSPASSTLTFNSQVIPSATFKEGNGTAEIVIPVGSLLATFSNNGRTITVAPAPAQAGQVAVTSGAAASAAPAAANGTPSKFRRYFAVVDASHGGSERGAAVGNELAEKDLTLAIGRQLRQELENRGIATLLIRDGDTTLTLDQRANLTNAVHPAIYICVHVSAQGSGVGLFTSLLPAGDDDRGVFLDWTTAQASVLKSSEEAAARLAGELRSRKIPVRLMATPLRPLNNLIVPAVAVEVSPNDGGIVDLISPAYQQLIASSLATGVAGLREQMGGGH